MQRNTLGQFVKVKQIPKKCLVCGNVKLYYPSDIKRGRGDYCSPKCAGIAMHSGVLKRNFKYIRKVVVCKFCGKEFKVKPSVTRRYCSPSCVGRGRWKDLKEKITIPQFPHDRQDHFNAVKIAKQHFNYWKCSICGNTKKICVHHKDHNPKNNSIDNLQLICNSCHAQYHTNLIYNGDEL
jgi:hypothetical protein